MGAGTDTVRQLIMGFRSTQLVHIAARLNLAARLAAGAKTAQELAGQVNAHPDALHRTLRALAALGLLTETPRR